MDRTIKEFSDLDAWKKGHALVLEIYALTALFPDAERFGMISQLRRAASSVTANIAEGFERFHFKDKAKFYYQSRGSLAEVQNFLLLARDLGFIAAAQGEKLHDAAIEVRKLINGLIKSLNTQQGGD